MKGSLKITPVDKIPTGYKSPTRFTSKCLSIRKTILCVWILKILTQTKAKVPQGVLLYKGRDATAQNIFLPVKNAKVVTTCTLIKRSYQFGIFQPFIKWNAQRAHTTIHIKLNLLLPSQLSLHGSAPASCPRMIKHYIYKQIRNILSPKYFKEALLRTKYDTQDLRVFTHLT